MYRWLIRTRGWRAALSLALAAGFLATPLGIAHVASAAPDPCDQIGSWPGGGETAVGAAPGLDDPHQHCFTCHWLQSLRSAGQPSTPGRADGITLAVVRRRRAAAGLW